MELPHDVPVRSARDRLIDVLGIGDTYPLSDLNVVADQLKVPFGGTARIPIESAQAGVVYDLCDPKGQPLGAAFTAAGRDATLVIETPHVSEDVTYRIRATKTPTGAVLPAQASRFLDETAPVQVGLDTTLVIEIVDFTAPGLAVPVHAPLLDSANANPQPSDPRIVPFGASVNVRVNNSQEGVQYSLMLDGRDLKDIVATGNLAGIVLATGPMLEDTVIQVRATKNFLAAENRIPETRPLDAKLYLKVIANPALAVSVAASTIVDFGKDALVTVAATQRSAKYRAYVHAVPDRDFVRGAGPQANLVTVPVPGQASVQVLKPALSEGWRTPDGYAPTGDGPVPGTGGDITFTLKSLTDDTMVVVQAIKDHQVDPNDPAAPTIPSAVRLESAAVVLVRPDPARALTLRVPIVGSQTGDSLQVSNGQPGVFYYFRPLPAGAEFPLPAYFHKRDSDDGSQNKGLNQLGLQVDFSIAAALDQSGPRAADPARAFPVSPILSISPIATDISLSSRAMKAQTAVEAPMALTAQIPPAPKIHADQPVIDLGGPATILIPASAPGEQYQLVLRGTPAKPAVAGTGADLSVVTDPLTRDAPFEVVVTRPGNSGMTIERVVAVPIVVRPDATLPVTAKLDSVDKGAGTDILVQASQPAVSYQLMSGQTPIGSAVAGTGSGIALQTGPLAADTTFTVVASRVDNAQVSVVLAARAAVKIKP